MKINQLFVVCGAVVALFLSAGNVSAQDNGGGGGGGGGGFGGGGFDPAAFQQRMMDNIRDQLGFTNDTDWNAVQPLVQKVMDAQRATRDTEAGRIFGGRNRGGDNNGGDNGGGRRRFGAFAGTPSPEATALQSAIDSNAPTQQIKDLLAKYQASHQAKLDALKQAQENLRQVLTVPQEAQATLLGLLN